jgi:hypothetical protein
VCTRARRNRQRSHVRLIGLDLAFKLLPLVAARTRDACDLWGCRWLTRWVTEADGTTIDQAAEIALAEVPVEPAIRSRPSDEPCAIRRALR